MTLERPGDRPFAPDEIELCRSVAMAVGPLLAIKRERDRPWLARQGLALGRGLRRVANPRRPLRLLGLALLLAAIAVAMLPGNYRVSATSTLEGAVRRVIVAPIDGYVITAEARPGDTVAAGDVLASFDDRDLRLERLQVAAEQAQLNTRLQEATANRQRAEAQVIRAQIEQSGARLALLDEQLARASLTSPFAAVVVSGDLSQSLGAPVRRGETLYELAPLDAYRVVLELDEHDIADIEPGQSGTLVLTALPDDPLPIVVRRITPVAIAAEGMNYFRVEADLEGTSGRLRPGMEGVAKVTVGRERLGWIWTHKLVRWIRLKAWAWLP
jgi:multidrug resistance efflux pump